jgi:hypothetical protein
MRAAVSDGWLIRSVWVTVSVRWAGASRSIDAQDGVVDVGEQPPTRMGEVGRSPYRPN